MQSDQTAPFTINVAQEVLSDLQLRGWKLTHDSLTIVRCLKEQIMDEPAGRGIERG